MKFSHMSKGFLWALILDPNIHQVYTIVKTGAHGTDPTRTKEAITRAHRTTLRIYIRMLPIQPTIDLAPIGTPKVQENPNIV